MDKKRLIIISLGDNIHTIRWANGFAELGWEVNIISINNKINERHEQNSNVRIIKLNEYVDIEKNNFINRIKKYKTLKNKLIVSKYDIVHIHFISTYSFFLLGLKNLIVSLWGKDIIWDYNYNEPFFKRSIKNRILKKVKYISTTSNFLKNTAISYHAKSEEKIRVIPFGVELNKFEPGREKFSSDLIRIVFVKHFETKYGPMLLLEAFNNLCQKNNNIKLTLIGDGQLKAEVINFIQKNNLTEKVELTGRLSHKEIIHQLDSSDIFVMPSIYQSESFGVAAIEASAMQLPIIVTKVGGVPEVVLHNKTGLLIEPNDVIEIEKAIDYLIKNRLVAKSLGIEGRNFVEKYYDWKNNRTAMEEYYSYILDNN